MVLNSMVETTKMSAKKQPSRQQVCEYIWARYIDNASPKIEVDEEQALRFFEDYYGKHPLNTDDECFYYGILLYERAFSDDNENTRARYLVKAKEVFEVYRSVSGETDFDAIEDRLADVNEMIESEKLLEKVKTVAELAPKVEGMVLVPGGKFLYGPEKTETMLEPFYIDVYPVTVKEYREFLEETSYRRPALWERRPDLIEDEMPVTGVSWMDAIQYCKWKKRSLPTSEQWEKAARGPDGFSYPWGEQGPTAENCNFLAEDWRAAALRPLPEWADNCKSPYGVCGMVGGVWEWTNTPNTEVEGTHLVKGGSYIDPDDPQWLSGYSTLWANKKEKNELIGFRTTRRFEVN
jgi:formylglycine-generating enzyme required for sulfatase activity